MIDNNLQRRPSIQLSLNGKPVYLLRPNISVTMRREEADMSGQKSSTKKSDKGIKAKEISVSGIIPYKNKQWLMDLFQLAEAVDEKGEQVKYRVSSITASAVNMREVQFSGDITASEQDQLLAWQISFKLREINSVAEKKEQRKKKPTTKTQTEKAPTATTEEKKQTTGQPQQEDKGFWKKLDELIGT